MSPLRPIARRALAAQSDERLVRLVREGHEPAFEEIVRRYRGPLVAFATAIVSHNRAEDVVQSSLEKAHRTLRADSRDVALRPWLFTIVRNGALNTIRGEPRTDELLAGSVMVSGPSEQAERREELERLVEAMCALPPAQRTALVRRELEGVGHAEIAAQLGTSATAVRGLIFRARTTVRNAVGAMVPLPLLRAMLADGPVATAGAAGAAGGGAGAAILGGSGAKGATVIAATVVALGTGIAIDHSRGGSAADKTSSERVATQESPRASTGSEPVGAPVVSARSTAVSPGSDSSLANGPSPSSTSGQASGDGPGSPGPAPAPATEGPSHDGGSHVGDGGLESRDSPERGSSGPGSDSSGPSGSADDAGSGGAIDDDSGSSDSGSSPGSGGTVLPPPPPPDGSGSPPPLDRDDSSGPSSGDGSHDGFGGNGGPDAT